jgi:type IV pilus assembly protein PilM
MAVQPGVWGIDVGQCALKAVRLQVIDGVVTATAFDYVEHPKILSLPDADPDQLTREALEKFLSRNVLKGDTVVMSVPGQSGLARFVKLPPVEEKKIGDIVRFEAKQQIPFPLDEVVWDYQKIGQNVISEGFVETEIGLFAMKRDMINRFMGHFTGVNIEVHVVQMSPLALCNYAAYDLLRKEADGTGEAEPEEGEEPTPRGKTRCVVVLDLGADNSNLVITDGQKVIWQRPIPIGGNHFTRALTKDLKLTFAKAEHLKRNAAKSSELGNILKALKPVLTEFVNEVQRSLSFFVNSHRSAHVAYLVGLGSAFKLPGLQKFLKEKLQLEVRKPNNFNRLSGERVTADPVFVENLLSFPVAYGLALQGLGLARLGTNLLPHEIRFDREVRARKPWAVAAASLLLLGTAGMAAFYGMARGAVWTGEGTSRTELGQAIDKSAGAIKTAEAKLKAISGVQSEVQQATKEVQSVVAGKYEQSNWLRLHQFINECLPMPGPKEAGGNMLSGPTLGYWNTVEGKDAWDAYQRLLRGEPGAERLSPERRANLPLIDLETVHCRFTDNLEGFFTAAKKDTLENIGRELEGMSDAEKNEPPKGAGWVIELRGTTWFEPTKTRQFLLSTLVQNLATRARVKSADGSDLPKDSDDVLVTKVDDAVKNRVSHVFLYNYRQSDPGSFALIGESVVDKLISQAGTGAPAGDPTAPGPGQTTPTAAPAAAANSLNSWVPLGSSSSAGNGGGNTPRTPYPGAGSPYPGGSRPPAGSGTPTTQPGEGASGAAGNSKSKRTEFVVIFVWQEPTPSDKFINREEGGAPAAPAAPAGGAGGPGGMQYPGGAGGPGGGMPGMPGRPGRPGQGA